MTLSLDHAAWDAVRHGIERFRQEIRELPVARSATPEALLRDVRSAFPFDAPRPLQSVVQDVLSRYRENLVHVTHPRMFGLFNPSVREAGILADALVAAFNPQLAVWSHAPAAAALEQHVLETLARVLGYPTAPLVTHFTSGGMEANLTAVLCALAARWPAWSQEGVGGLAARGIRPTLYVTGESHHSFVKIARMTGLGTAALREVPVDAWLRMDPAALRDALARDAAGGETPVLIVATLGSTGSGVCDPLPAIADVAAAGGAWLHVDAAWGGTAAFSPRFRPLFRDIARADSVTWDAHKWMSVPMGAGMFFTRHPEAAAQAFAVTASYMPPGDGADDPMLRDGYGTSAQWSRRSLGTKVAMSLAELGIDGYRALVERMADLGEFLRDRLRAAGWVIANETPLPVVNFTDPEIRGGRRSAVAVARAVQDEGHAWVSDVVIGGRERVIRACITSFETAEADVEALVHALGRARAVADARPHPSSV